MTNPSTRSNPKYKALGDVLLSRLGSGRSLAWLADQTIVSTVAVHLWVTGQCRPKPKRLGFLSAILQFSEDELGELTKHAGYLPDSDQELQVYEAYREWHNLRERRELDTLAQNIVYIIGDKCISLIRTDVEVRRIFREKHPEFLEMADQASV